MFFIEISNKILFLYLSILIFIRKYTFWFYLTSRLLQLSIVFNLYFIFLISKRLFTIWTIIFFFLNIAIWIHFKPHIFNNTFFEFLPLFQLIIILKLIYCIALIIIHIIALRRIRSYWLVRSIVLLWSDYIITPCFKGHSAKKH